MTAADKVCLCLSHLSGSLIKTIKKSFQKKEGRGEQKHEKKRRECCLIQFISELCLPFPFFIAGFLSSSASQHRFSGFRFLTEPTDLTILSKDFSPILFNCEAEVDEGFPTIVTRWKRNGQFLQFPDFNGRRYVVIILSRFNSELFSSQPHFFHFPLKISSPPKTPMDGSIETERYQKSLHFHSIKGHESRRHGCTVFEKYAKEIISQCSERNQNVQKVLYQRNCR